MVGNEDATEVKVVTYYRLSDRFSSGVLILKDKELKAFLDRMQTWLLEAEAKTA